MDATRSAVVLVPGFSELGRGRRVWAVRQAGLAVSESWNLIHQIAVLFSFRGCEKFTRLSPEQFVRRPDMIPHGARRSFSFSFFYPRFDSFPRLSCRFVNPPPHRLRTNFRLLPCSPGKAADQRVCLTDDGDLRLVLPAEVCNIAHGYRDQHPASRDPDRGRDGGT